MTATQETNGKPRRSLNDTIGRMDQLIDGLSDAIPETIRDTLTETVSLAVADGVRAAVVEVLSNPALLAAVRGQAHRPQPVPLRERVRQAIQKSREVVAQAKKVLATSVRKTVHVVGGGISVAWVMVSRMSQLRWPLLIAVSAGIVGVTVALVGPAWIGTVLSGIGGMATAGVLQAGLWVRRTLRPLLAS